MSQLREMLFICVVVHRVCAVILSDVTCLLPWLFLTFPHGLDVCLPYYSFRLLIALCGIVGKFFVLVMRSLPTSLFVSFSLFTFSFVSFACVFGLPVKWEFLVWKLLGVAFR